MGATAAPLETQRLPGPPAGAPPNGAAQRAARTLERDAAAAVKKGDCASALSLYAQAYALAGTESALSGAFGCRAQQNDVLGAHDLLVQLLELHTPAQGAARTEREAKLAELRGKTVVVAIKVNEAGATVELDGQPGVTTGADGTLPARRLLVGAHTVRASKPGFDTHEQNVELTAVTTEIAIVLKATVTAAPATDRGAVLDFCRMKLEHSKTRSTKQRLVLFDVAGEAITSQPEEQVNDKGEVIAQHTIFREISMHDHVRASFLKTFPMQRFHNVKAQAMSPDALRKRAKVSSADMIAAAATDTFAAYSIACADWVAMPRVTKKQARWKTVKKKKNTSDGKQVEYMAFDLSLVWTMEVDVFQHVADGWKLIATVEGDNGGLGGFAAGLAAAAATGGKSGNPLAQISQRPDPKCSVPGLSLLQGVEEGISACYGATEQVTAAASAALEVEASSDEQDDASTEEKPSDEGAPSSDAASTSETGAATAAEATQASEGTAANATPAESTSETTAPSTDVTATESAAAAASEVEATVEDAEAIKAQAMAAVKAATTVTSPEALDKLAALAAAGLDPETTAAAQAAQTAVTQCKGAVDTIAKAGESLRALAAGPDANMVLGFAACFGVDLTVDLGEAVAPGTTALRSDLCKNVIDDVSQGAAAMRSIATCAGPVAAERATLFTQKGCMEEVWPLIFELGPPIASAPEMYGCPLGKDMGVKRGHRFVALAPGADGEEDQIGFGRIMLVGPGGADGEKDPSHFRFRAGDAPVGTKMKEYPLIGILLGLRPQLSLFTSLEGPDSIGFGGAIEGGYDATDFVPFADEVWSRVFFGFDFVGEATLISIDLVPEVTYYLASRLAVFAGPGFSYTFISVGEGSASASGGNAGVLAHGGLDYAIAPDFSLRATLSYRQGFGGVELENNSAVGGGTTDIGSLSAFRLGLGGSYTF